ncbi:hypothetical protein S7711_07039 [Stachybotrys chartarum IBT 7711]|uniref:Uncharacterized protein n=1 Tax=Stachybotrys chartarum (strain CBS 109288 / IBT 7711) TaxID=1280523 RepID=A0A084ASK8_STACB|nr:hypothetical protein S7711_07039 [Stachybotrys chartarum IBT 7711]
MSGNDNGTSASDIITYIGVPLAVLGVLPILYNTFATLASLSRIKHMLKRSRLTALTRSDVVNRVIEIELPRYAVMPLDRFQNRDEYWSLSQHPSSIPGGSWTTFNWKTNTIGMKTQRVEYADQVRQPQVEIAFDELVCYLMDLGAVPDPQGWKLLRATGLWTPVGCSLMVSPDGKAKALTVGPQDDADGNLSLAVAWSSEWTTRDHVHLPPYWVRLPAPESEPKTEGNPESPQKGQGKKDENEETGLTDSVSGTYELHEMDSVDRQVHSNAENDITCQILASGIVTAFADGDMESNTTHDLYIDHLRIQPLATAGVWFASAATAYGTTSKTVLWSYKIPEEILRFSRMETVPCGIMVLLGWVDEEQTPSWATSHDDAAASTEMFMRRSRESHMAMIAEAKMNPADRQKAAQERMRREMNQRMQDFSDKARLERQRGEQRMMEALQSPKWNTKLVAEHSLRWLQTQNTYSPSLPAKEVVGYMLHRMVRDQEFTSKLCRMLDLWRAWANIGGMKRSDYQLLQEDPATFAHAALLVALIMDTSTALEGTLSMDLQECLRLWSKVRLG